MNVYGDRAMDYWRRFRPTAYQAIPHPQEFFSTLGEQIADQVQMLADQLAGPDIPDEGYLGKVGRLNNATMRAAEMAMNDLVYSSPPEDEEDEEGEEGEDPDDLWTRLQHEQFQQQTADREQYVRERGDEADRAWRERTGQPPLT